MRMTENQAKRIADAKAQYARIEQKVKDRARFVPEMTRTERNQFDSLLKERDVACENLRKLRVGIRFGGAF